MIKGKPKGDGLCCYLAKESVDLALDILDGDIVEGHKISVRFHFFPIKDNITDCRFNQQNSN